MKYKDLIQFDPIDEIIKFSKLDNEDYRSKIVGNFVCSRTYEEYNHHCRGCIQSVPSQKRESQGEIEDDCRQI